MRQTPRQLALQFCRAIEDHPQPVVIFAEVGILHHLLQIGLPHEIADLDAEAQHDIGPQGGGEHHAAPSQQRSAARRPRLEFHETVAIALTIAQRDGYNFTGVLWSQSGKPVYVPTQAKVLENALTAFDGTVLAFSERFIRDGRVRANYVEQAKAASRELQAYVSMSGFWPACPRR